MADLIDRDELRKDFCNMCEAMQPEMIDCEKKGCMSMQIIDEQPTVDAEPARRGRWETREDYDGDVIYRCSACGEEWTLIAGTPKENNMYYCPNCGARMNGGADNG